MPGAALDNEQFVLARLRDLALVELESLLVGTAGQERSELLATYIADLADALRRVRDLIHTLLEGTRQEPLRIVEHSSSERSGELGRASAIRSVQGLRDRASLLRRVAVLDELAACVLGKLIEAEHGSG